MGVSRQGENRSQEPIERQQPRGTEHDFRRDRPPARFEDAFADRGGANDALAALHVLADKMRDGIEPFGFPGQDTSPHLVALVGSDFAFEGTLDRAQPDREATLAEVE